MNEEERIKIAKLLLSICDLLDTIMDTAIKVYSD